MLDGREQTLSGVRLLLGAPGSGKTYQLLQEARAYLESGQPESGLLVLTPSRLSATRFRQQLMEGLAATVSSPPVRAWQAYAFDLLLRGQAAGYLPALTEAPKLLSGPEQDVLIRQLLEGHRLGQGKPLVWPDDLSEALPTAGFRQEVREFFDRLAEYDLSAQQLEDLASSQGRPVWAAVAGLYREYRQVRNLRAPNAYDPAALIHEAVRLLLAQPDFLAAERRRLRLVLVDDVQELTPSIYRLLTLLTAPSLEVLSAPSAMSSRGLDSAGLEALSPALAASPGLLLAACGDTVVQGFRGAQPGLLSLLDRIYGRGLERHYLTDSWRMAQPLADAWAHLAARLPQIPGAVYERQLKVPEAGASPEEGQAQRGEGAVQGLLLASQQEENQLLAQMILEDHLYRGLPYSQNLIVVRQSSDISRLKRALTGLGLPVRTAAAATPLRDEPAVRPFLDALGLILHTQRIRQQEAQLGAEGEPETSPAWGLQAETATALLTSRLGGASSLEVRRLRQHLRAAELRSGGGRTSDDLLVEALVHPQLLPQRSASQAARRLSRVLTAGAQALSQPGASPGSVLWALWQASGLAEIWKAQALAGGEGSERANRDLDAIMGLFEAAERYSDQLPGASAQQFLHYIDAQDLPMDTLAARASHQDAVEILTPALAAGRQWDKVYVAGLQEGVWPNTTLRGSLLGSQDLVDLVTGRQLEGTGNYLERLKETRYDEFRMFATAVSRARQTVTCTAVFSQDDAPSELLSIYAPLPPEQEERPLTQVRRPMTLRSLVAELRQAAEAQQLSPAKAQAAARLLARLSDTEQTAGRPVAGATPEHWWGLLPLSSTAAAFSPKAPVPLSPSQVGTIHSSPLDWFVSAARAQEASSTAQSLGTLIHSICEDYPQGTYSQLEAALEERLPSLGLDPEDWETQQLIERAQKMLGKFASYVGALEEKEGRRLLGVEGSFQVLVTGPARQAMLSGRVDRLEQDRLGRLVIIDIKTGKNKPTKKEIERFPQLAVYQVALAAGAAPQLLKEAQSASTSPSDLPANPSGGAVLLQIGDKNKSFSAQTQEALEAEESWAWDLVHQAAELISGASLQARHDPANPWDCRLPQICPLCQQGRQITVRPAPQMPGEEPHA